MAMESRTIGPAIEPVCTKGNVFWKGDERFSIRGISYIPEDSLTDPKSNRDLLADDCLNDLKRDVQIFRELGLNTIRVMGLSSTKNHSKAMRLLREAGIYVFVELFEKIECPGVPSGAMGGTEVCFDTAPYYTYEILKDAAQIADEVADHPNLLGFIVCGDAVRRPGTSKIAEVHRAAVADIKHFLQLRGGRNVPVGIGIGQYDMLRQYLVQYFTAGSPDDRADFFAPDYWSWAYKSTFAISGWKNLVDNFAKYPLPMFLRSYGGYVGKPRIWQEVECLYSPQMAGVFSGGCLHTYFESGNNYGIVKIRKDGTVQKKPEFETLKKRFEGVDMLPRNMLDLSDVRENSKWIGEFPKPTPERGHATSMIPRFSGSWNELIQRLEDEKDWIFIDKMSLSDTDGSK